MRSKGCLFCSIHTQGPVQHINNTSPHMVLHGLDFKAAFTLGKTCKMVLELISTVTHYWYRILSWTFTVLPWNKMYRWSGKEPFGAVIWSSFYQITTLFLQLVYATHDPALFRFCTGEIFVPPHLLFQVSNMKKEEKENWLVRDKQTTIPHTVAAFH